MESPPQTHPIAELHKQFNLNHIAIPGNSFGEWPRGKTSAYFETSIFTFLPFIFSFFTRATTRSACLRFTAA
jgi:hypothetical protein